MIIKPTVIIPMSGIGKRFISAGYTNPKPLIQVDGIEMIKHVANLFPGTQEYIFVCNEDHLNTPEYRMREILESIPGKNTIVSIKPHKLGPVYAVLQAKELISDDKDYIVSYCDYSSLWDYDAFLKKVCECKADGAIATYRGFHPHMLGTDQYAFLRVERDDDGVEILQEIQEKKPFTDNRMEEHASNGTYYFSRGSDLKHYFQQLVDLRLQTKNEYYVSNVYNLMVKDGKRIIPFEIECMLQWGTPKDLKMYNAFSEYFKDLVTTSQTDLNKGVNLNETTLVLPMAGRGTRYSKAGFKLPKPLIPINNEPLVVQAVKCLPKCERNIFIVLEEHQSQHDLTSILPGDVITVDDVTDGQACTCDVGIVNGGIDEDTPILISACDNGVWYDWDKCLEMHSDKDIDVIVWTFKNHPTSVLNPNMYSYMEVKEGTTNATGVSVKKAISSHPENDHTIIGSMFFRKRKYFTDGYNEIYRRNITTNGEYYVDNVLQPLIEQGLNVQVFCVDHYVCWGTADDYKTFVYWQNFFDKCDWHPYKMNLDPFRR